METPDQALDPQAMRSQKSAKKYDTYLHRGYDLNAPDGCFCRDKHVLNMRGRFANWVVNYLERTGLKRRDVNIAIVGPGHAPVGRELDHTIVEAFLKRFRSITLVDIVPKVVQSAVESLRSAGVGTQQTKVFGLLYDVTDGLGGAYEKVIADRLASVRSGNDLMQAAKDLAAVRIEDLEVIAKQQPGGIPWGPVSPEDLPLLLERKLNPTRTWSWTVEGEVLPLHLVALQMVLAGTGAAAERPIWDKFQEHLGLRVLSKPQCDEATEFRIGRIHEEFFRNVHALITRYNTEVARRIVHKILSDNPSASVLAISDLQTRYKREFTYSGWLTFPRLDESVLEKELEALGIRMGYSLDWYWDDDPNHMHPIKDLTFRIDSARLGEQVQQ